VSRRIPELFPTKKKKMFQWVKDGISHIRIVSKIKGLVKVPASADFAAQYPDNDSAVNITRFVYYAMDY
jgi:hypothetical protein